MELWVFITIGAAFFQNLRSALQKHLKGQLDTSGATFARFIYALPVAVIYLALLNTGGAGPLPTPGADFVAWVLVAAVSQILATALLVHLFAFKNFAVGTAFSKTETVQTALFGIVVLADPLSWQAALAICISLFGVMLMSVAKDARGLRALLLSWTGKPALIGLASGALFGVAAISVRGASLSLNGDGFLMPAAVSLVAVLTVQTLGMGAYLLWREPGQFARVARAWRVASWVGLCGMIASAGWFTAMTLQNAAYVRALGQIELIFTFIAAVLFFRERPGVTETLGIMFVTGGIVVLLLG